MYLIVGIAGMARPALAQHADSVATDTLAPGVIHRHLVDSAGPWNINVLTIDLRGRRVRVVEARADGRLRGRERVSDIARDNASDSATVLAGVNGDFFDLATGENENNQVIDGEIWKATSRTPADSARYVRSQLAIMRNGRPEIAESWLIANVSLHGNALFALDGINRRTDVGQLVLYTEHFGRMTPYDSSNTLRELPLRALRHRGDTLRYVVASMPVSAGTTLLTERAALSLPRNDTSRGIPHPGDTITIAPFWVHFTASPRLLIGGWPRLVMHGRSIADSVDRLEGTTPAFSVTRHPRTGAGFSRDSTTLYLITVDGRQESSSGMSLAEFADLMVQLGVFEGLNLDGGGSTTMVVNGRVVNHPSDPGGERTVGDALLVERRP